MHTPLVYTVINSRPILLISESLDTSLPFLWQWLPAPASIVCGGKLYFWSLASHGRLFSRRLQQTRDASTPHLNRKHSVANRVSSLQVLASSATRPPSTNMRTDLRRWLKPSAPRLRRRGTPPHPRVYTTKRSKTHLSLPTLPQRKLPHLNLCKEKLPSAIPPCIPHSTYTLLTLANGTQITVALGGSTATHQRSILANKCSKASLPSSTRSNRPGIHNQ
ncbi:hypothetical protein BC830DRAFT_779369 [Chytriomyces sp. MP71]|nr:hypothetical protein BC830DRAFT_779369 [Chytriomyces sp. MP71]